MKSPLAPFIIFSLPRSRSFWLAHFLSYPPRQVGHDAILHCKKIDDFVELFTNGNLAGTCETGAVLGWRLIKQYLPRTRFVVIKRPISQVQASMAKFNLQYPQGELELRKAMMEAVEAEPGTLTFSYDDLGSIEACRRIFEFCLQIRFDGEWWERYANTNIQVNMQDRIDHLQRNHSTIQNIRNEMITRLKDLPRASLG